MIMVVYHEQKVSRKSGWKENGTRIFGFQRKISGSRGKSEKVVLFPRSEQSRQKFAFLFFAVIFDTVSGLRGRYSVNGNDLYKW